MNGTGLSFSFQGVARYAYPKGTNAWFHWQASMGTLQFGGSYSAPGSTALLFSFQDGVHPASFVATVWGGTMIHYDSLRVFPYGFKSEAFGSVVTRQTRFVNVSGGVRTLFGTGLIYNTKQTAQATGFKDSKFGLGSIYNLRRYVYAAGAQHTTFGTQLVEHTDIRPAGIALFTRWGTAHPYNKTTKLYPLGKDHSVFGTGLHVDNHKFTIDGLIHTKWGLPLIKNYKQLVTPLPTIQTKWGTSWASNKIRRVYAYHIVTTYLGPDNNWVIGTPPIAMFGTPKATHRNITPVGKSQTKFGTTWISGPQYIAPFGIHDRFFGNKTIVESTIRSPFPVGFVATQFGSFASKPQFIHMHGSDMSHFPDIWPYYPRVGGTKITGVGLGNTSRIGTPFVSFTPRYIRPGAIVLHTTFGSPPYGVMHTFIQHIQPPLMMMEKWGREAWDYRLGMHVVQIERDAVQGFVGSSFGTPQAADGERWRWEHTRLSKVGFTT